LRFHEVLGHGVPGSDQPGGGAQAIAGGRRIIFLKLLLKVFMKFWGMVFLVATSLVAVLKQ
jgi:hypothetical protein